jgi:hypothetical protein
MARGTNETPGSESKGGRQELRVFKTKTTAHRKKTKGDLSYSLAGVVSLAFGPIPKAPQRGLG